MFGRDEQSIGNPLDSGAVHDPGYLSCAGLWIVAAAVMQSDLYATLAEKNRIRNVPILGLVANFGSRRASHW